MGLRVRTGAITPGRGLVFACMLAVSMGATRVQAQQILPADFFEQVPAEAGEDIAVTAETLEIDQTSGLVTAQGNVGISYAGVRTAADRAVYNQATGAVELIGNVAVIDEDGVEYVAERVELEGDFRQGFVESLLVALPDGTYLSAARTEITQDAERIFEDGLYSPCGTCIDDEGRRIGWQVRAARVVTDAGEEVVYFDEPRLELLGLPVLYLPYLSLPREGDIELPVFDYREEYGLRASFPFFRYEIDGGTLLLTPSLFSRQGAMLGAQYSRDTGDFAYDVGASGIYQLDPQAYDGLANRRFRGALEAAFTFTPLENWTFGGEGTLFTDPAYLPDYDYSGGIARNQLFAEYFTPESFADTRLQQFVPLSNAEDQDAYDRLRARQAVTFPNARGDHVVDLDDGLGRVTLEGSLLALSRGRDDPGPNVGETQFYPGFEGQKIHAMAQASWTNQFATPPGLLISPYLGLRADAADYDGASEADTAPASQSLFAATPIAALDVRYPLAFSGETATTVVEPIAQLVYRGSDESAPGITNDDAQGLVFDDTNLFDFNRFSGADRQETGLRANVGGQVQAEFSNGAWVGAIGGQSFQLAGPNAFAADDGTITGLGTGLDTDASYIVAGVSGAFSPYLSAGGKVQIDPEAGTVPSALALVNAQYEDYSLEALYLYDGANPVLDTTRDQHEIQIGAAIPIADYWTLDGGVAWDLAADEWLQAEAGLEYNDGFLAYGASTRITGETHRTPNDLRFLFSFRLRNASSTPIVGLDYTYEPEDY